MPPAPRARPSALPPPAAAAAGRSLHSSPRRRLGERGGGGDDGDDHYARLGVGHDASPAQIKKSFYALSKTHHPDVNPAPAAAAAFARIAESYALLSDPPRRAAHDRDLARRRCRRAPPAEPRRPGASYASTAPAGGRAPSGLSRRRAAFRGPAPSFYRNGGWGAHAEARRRAHEESTGAAASSASSSSSPRPPPGMGPGPDPFRPAHAAPHFDREAHARTHQAQDRRRWQRERRALGDYDVDFEPQTSLAAHFLIVVAILGVTFLAPAVYLHLMRLGRRGREND